MSPTKPMMTWASMHDSTSSGKAQLNRDGPLWRPSGQPDRQQAPQALEFPALDNFCMTRASSPQLKAPLPSHTSPGRMQSSSQHQQHVATAPSHGSLRGRKSRSVPALATAIEQQLAQPFRVVASGGSRAASTGRCVRAGPIRQQHSEPQGAVNIHISMHQSDGYPSQAFLDTPLRGGQKALPSAAKHTMQQGEQRAAQPLLKPHQPDEQLQEQSHSEAAMQLLQESHPWCDAAVLHDALLTFQGDVAAALQAVEAFRPPVAMQPDEWPGSCSDGMLSSVVSSSIQHGQGHRTMQPAAAASSDDRQEAAASKRPQRLQGDAAAAQQTQLPPQRSLWPKGSECAAVDDQMHHQHQRQRQHQQTSPNERSAALSHNRLSVRQPAAPTQQQQQQHSGGQDTYHNLRGAAVRLSNQHRTACRKAATARAGGDQLGAAQHAAEAVRLKQAADAAHAAAALKIEVANNVHRPDGLWELDLHGLHADEAVQALQARIELLQDIARDLVEQLRLSTVHDPAAVQVQSRISSVVTASTMHSKIAGVQNTKQAVLTSLLMQEPKAVLWSQQLAATRQELRVIVGKGLHSSEGEPVLPRVVEQWLMQQGFKYVWRAGCIGVQLKVL